MNNRPLIVALAKGHESSQPSHHDQLTAEDTLPAVLDQSSDGYVISRQTFVTDVTLETTDDN